MLLILLLQPAALAACGSAPSAASTEIASCRAVRAFVDASIESRSPLTTGNDPGLFDSLNQVAKGADNAYVRQLARDLMAGKRYGTQLGTLVTDHCMVVNVPMGSVLLSGVPVHR